MSFARGVIYRPAVSFEVSSEGFKGTNYSLTCRDFKYKLGVRTPQISSVKTCVKGYHYRKHLTDTFLYYNIFTSRFFKVKAKNSYTEFTYEKWGLDIGIKSVAEQIVLLEEINEDELFKSMGSINDNTFIRGNFEYMFEQAAWNLICKLHTECGTRLDIAIECFNAVVAPFCFISCEEDIRCNRNGSLTRLDTFDWSCYFLVPTTEQVFKDLRKICLQFDESIDNYKNSIDKEN